MRAGAAVTGLQILSGVSFLLLEAWATLRSQREDPARPVGVRGRLAGVARELLRPGSRGPHRDRGTKRVVLLTAVVGVELGWLAVLRLPGLRLPGSPAAWVLAGLAVSWAGVLLRVWAVCSLGRFFRRVVVVQEGHRVVTSGPYRYVRHPAYAGGALLLLGYGLTLGNAAGVAACVLVPLVGWWRRIAVEEAELRATLGRPYEEYARRTSRLVPKVW